MKLTKQNHTPPPDAIQRVLWENEVHANKLIAGMMVCCAFVMMLCSAFTAMGIFAVSLDEMHAVTFATMLSHLVPSIICFWLKGAKPWLKYLLMFGTIIGQAGIDAALGYNVPLTILLPVIFSCRYYSRRMTFSVAAITTFIFFCTTWVGAATGFSPLDRNIYAADETYVQDILVMSFFPKWLMFAVISGVCAEIANRGRKMVWQQALISQEHSRVETELETASKIQLGALPETTELLASREAPFELVTSISPAKEIGGDFYDFFYIDPIHLALIIADVSGKGVPAALFMMISKLLLDASAASGKAPHQVLAEVNHQLCEKNINDMFVTVWLGILDLTTGELVSANAGHEHPIICRRDGTVEVIRTKHGMVLGGVDGVPYRDETCQLAPGDTLFVYTDGIPEAHNPAEEMYGMEQLENTLQANASKPPQALVDAVKRDVSAFSGNAPQFDDSTMLALRLNRFMVREGLHIFPDNASIKKVQEYAESCMEAAGVPLRQANKINIALDEMYSNIARYSGATWAEVICHTENSCVTVILRDNGVPYNPLNLPEPDITQSAEERHIGGLGIYMTRKMMDDVSYRYVDGCNEMTMMLRFS